MRKNLRQPCPIWSWDRWARQTGGWGLYHFIPQSWICRHLPWMSERAGITPCFDGLFRFYIRLQYSTHIQQHPYGYSTINDLLRFLFAAHVWFVNTPVPTRLRLKQALVFTDNVQLTTKSSYMSCYNGTTIWVLLYVYAIFYAILYKYW